MWGPSDEEWNVIGFFLFFGFWAFVTAIIWAVAYYGFGAPYNGGWHFGLCAALAYLTLRKI